MGLGDQRSLPSTDAVRLEPGLKSQVEHEQQRGMVRASPAREDMGGGAKGAGTQLHYSHLTDVAGDRKWPFLVDCKGKFERRDWTSFRVSP